MARRLALLLVLSLLAATAAAAQASQVVVEQWPAADLTAVSLALGLDPWQAPRGGESLAALYAEMLLLEMNAGLRQREGPAATLVTRLPAHRGVDLDRRRDYIAITVNTTRDGALAAVQFLRRFVFEAKFTPEDLETARKVALQRRDAWLGSVLEPTEQLLVRALWDGCAGLSAYGTEESLQSLSLADLEAFRAAVATGKNAWFAIVGAGDAAGECRRAAEEAVAALPPTTQPLRAPRVALGGRVVVEDNPALDRAFVALGAPLPPFGTREYWAGWVVREMLAGPEGRLQSDRMLMVRLGLILPQSLTWQQWPVTVLPIEFGRCPYLGIYAMCYPPRLELTREGILRHLALIASGDFSDDELTRAHARAANLWAREIAAPRDRARLLAVAAMLGTDLPGPQDVATAVAGVTREEVREMAYSVLGHLSVGIQLPRS